jgi:hypothetical protein
MMRIRFIAVGIGIGLAIAALATNNRTITWAAIAALVTSLVLRLIIKRRES